MAQCKYLCNCLPTHMSNSTAFQQGSERMWDGSSSGNRADKSVIAPQGLDKLLLLGPCLQQLFRQHRIHTLCKVPSLFHHMWPSVRSRATEHRAAAPTSSCASSQMLQSCPKSGGPWGWQMEEEESPKHGHPEPQKNTQTAGTDLSITSNTFAHCSLP